MLFYFLFVATSGPPHNIHVSLHLPLSLLISWEAPVGISNINGYIVQYNGKLLTTQSTELNITTDLQQGETYTICIYAYIDFPSVCSQNKTKLLDGKTS